MDSAPVDLAQLQRDLAGGAAGNAVIGMPLLRFIQAIDYAVVLEQHAETLAAEVARLREALEFYGDPKNYECRDNVCNACGDIGDGPTNVDDDAGHKARAALVADPQEAAP